MSHRWATPIADLLARLGQEGPVGSFPIGPSVPVLPGSVWGLTGATGWWGRHFARALLAADPQATLIVPVRARDRTEAMTRLHAVWAPSDRDRRLAHDGNWWPRTHALAIRAIEDAPENGGLRPWRGLDAVVHAAADTSLASTVDEAWAANVRGVQRAWEWAASGGARRFDHISTLSVWVAGDTPPGALLESEKLDASARLWGGYAASKWAAEAWLSRRIEGPSVSVHRLGLVGHSSSEGWASADPLGLTAHAWARWGRPSWVAPRPSEKVDWSPVDRTVAGVQAVARDGAVGPFHWASRLAVPAQDWVDALARRFGAQHGEWPTDHPLGKAARRAWGRWSDPSRAQRWWWHDAFQSDRHRFAAERASLHLPRWSWSPEDLDRALAHVPIFNDTGHP